MAYEPKPRLRPPEYIRLPGNVRVRTQDLLNLTANRANHNLRTGTITRGRRKS